MERVRIVVRGLVQGVGFRYNTRAEASRLGLTGYVKNLPDGTVEIVAEGEAQPLRELAEWAKQGPPAANVKEIGVTYNTAQGEFGIFSIER